MDALALSTPKRLDLKSPAIVLLAIVIVYASNWWPTTPVRVVVLQALHLTTYERWGIFLPHLLLYSTIMAALSGVLWIALASAGWLPRPPLGNLRQSVMPGVVGGLLALICAVLTALAFFPLGTVRWIDPNPWKIAGNIFSNFYEEFIWRGFLLFGLRELVGFWPAAVISSASWAVLHTQYPLAGQVLVFAIGIGFAWLVRVSRSLWAP
jgi:membrane protease YdiL (CAAX protease family)